MQSLPASRTFPTQYAIVVPVCRIGLPRRNPVLMDGNIRRPSPPGANIAPPEGKTALHQLPLLPRRAGCALLRRGLFKGADVAEAKGSLGKGAAILMAIWVLLGVLPVLAQMP